MGFLFPMVMGAPLGDPSGGRSSANNRKGLERSERVLIGVRAPSDLGGGWRGEGGRLPYCPKKITKHKLYTRIQIENSAEFRVVEPPRETKISFKNRIVREIGGKITAFD